MNLKKSLFPHFFSLLICSLLVIGGCSSSKQTTRQNIKTKAATEIEGQNAYDPNIINPGDEIEIIVWQNDEFNTRTTVTSEGTIAMPLIGVVTVAGKTKEELDRELTEKLQRYIQGEIRLTISLISKRENIISVFGAVSSAQNVQLVDEISLFELLAMAGGPATDADLRHVKVYRRDHDPRYSTINLNEYLEEGRLDPSIKVGPGDVVYIPREKNFIREFSGFLRDVVLVFGLFRAVN